MIEGEFRCMKCQSILDGRVQAVLNHHGVNVVTLSVVPCSHCMEETRKKAYHSGIVKRMNTEDEWDGLPYKDL